MSLQTIWPLIWVTDMRRSLDFYRDGLGFELVASWELPQGIAWCRLKRGPVSLMLQLAPGDVPPPVEGQAAELYILCDDARALHAEFAARGIQATKPERMEYDMLQFRVTDPDGYPLWFENPV
ncbi:MAG: VOC family protein [Chloroflexota bacterium]|nr:VOC family protein [Chloroflexota bacterium]MDE2897309.1 VOC family protein [Chloroflexota bacterium]